MRWPRCGIAVLSLVALSAQVGCGSDGALDAREAAVAERGARVMPFDLDRSTHRFTPQPDGLVQTVRAHAPADPEQVALIREHLRYEAERFQAGDLSDPAAIHGHDMPGLRAIEAGADRIDVTYVDLEDGGEIRYRTDAPELVVALHDWAAAQLRDHGAHAESGHVDDR